MSVGKHLLVTYALNSCVKKHKNVKYFSHMHILKIYVIRVYACMCASMNMHFKYSLKALYLKILY